MKQQKLNDLSATIKELRKLGTFTEEDVEWLEDMDIVMEQLSNQAQEKIKIDFKNHTNNPDPKLEGNKITLKSYLTSEFFLKPLEISHFSTGIEFILQSNIVLNIKTVRELSKLGILCLHHYFNESILYITLINCNGSGVTFKPGEDLVDINFIYSLGEEMLILNKTNPE